jgi:short-subunit dehydrogenase
MEKKMPDADLRPAPATPLKPRQRAILIGASSGIGAALARRLAREGYTLALLARRAGRLEALCAEINSAHNEIRAIYYLHDAKNFNEVPGLLQKIVAEIGGLDVFVFNAGILLPTTPTAYDWEKDHETLAVNALGAIAWFDAVAPLFQAARAGSIVGISSVAGDRGRVLNPAYNTSKAALSTYLEALRNRLTRYGVHVLTVKPGFVETDMLKVSGRKTFGTISADKAADDIWRAIRSRKQVIYTPGLWRWIMLIVRHIPSIIFRRLNF